MYAINKLYGIGQVTEENETIVTVKFEEVEKSLLKFAVKMYATYEEAEAALNEVLATSERTFTCTTSANAPDAETTERMRENAFRNQRGSWMR